MANEIEIRIGSRDNTGAGFASATSHQGKLRDAVLATRKAALAAADADAKMAAAQREAADVAAKLAREELVGEEALNRAAAAAREVERASIKQTEAHHAAARAADHEAAQERELARALSRSSREADTSSGMFKRMFTSLEKASTSAADTVSKGLASLADASPLMVAGVVAGLAALPAAAVAVGGAVTLALGGALTAVAIMAAAKNAAVEKSFTDLKTHVGSSLKDMAKPFVPVLEHIATVASATFDKLAPSLKGAFAQMAPSVSHFADMFGQSLVRLGPMITKIGEAFAPLIAELGDRMPAIMDNVATGLEKIMGAVSTHQQDFGNFVESLSKVVVLAGDATSALADLYPTISKFASVPDDPWSFLKDASPLLNGVAGLWNAVGDAVGGSEKGWSEASAASWDAQKSVTAASDAMVLASTSADELKTALDALSGGQLDARDAARKFQQAIDDMTSGLKHNGKGFDINTEKGRENQKQLDKIASTGIALSDALKLTDKSGRASAKSMNDTRAAYIHAAIAGGLNRDAAIKLADAMGLVATRAGKIPGKTETKVLGDIHDLQAKVDAAKAKLKTVPPSKRAAVLADIRDLERKVAAAKRDLASIQNRDVTVTTHYVSHAAHALKNAHGGVIGAYADGGLVRGSDGDSAGTTLVQVGEAGRELVRLPYGSTVIPHGQTEAMLGDDGDYETDDDVDGYASGGVVRRRHHRRRRARHPRKKKLGVDSQYTHHGNGPGPTGAYNWNISQSLKNKLSNKQTKMVAPPPHVPNWWHGQASESFGPGGASLSWSAPRPEDVAGTPQAQKLTTAEIEHNAQAAIEKRVAAVVAAAMKQHKQVIEIHSNGSDHSDYLIAMLRKAIRAKGGNVQIILGK